MYIHIYIYIYIYIELLLYIYIYIYVYIYRCSVYIYIYIYIHSVYIYIHIHICIHIYIYIYIHTSQRPSGHAAGVVLFTHAPVVDGLLICFFVSKIIIIAIIKVIVIVIAIVIVIVVIVIMIIHIYIYIYIYRERWWRWWAARYRRRRATVERAKCFQTNENNNSGLLKFLRKRCLASSYCLGKRNAGFERRVSNDAGVEAAASPKAGRGRGSGDFVFYLVFYLSIYTDRTLCSMLFSI